MAVSPALVSRLLAVLREGGMTPAAPAPAKRGLSLRELEVLQLVADGLSNKEIGQAAVDHRGHGENHVHNARQKLEMDNRIQAAAYTVPHGLGAHRGQPTVG